MNHSSDIIFPKHSGCIFKVFGSWQTINTRRINNISVVLFDFLDKSLCACLRFNFDLFIQLRQYQYVLFYAVHRRHWGWRDEKWLLSTSGLLLGLRLAIERHCYKAQYIPRNMHTVFALLCFVVVIHWLIFPYPSGLLRWHCGDLTIAPVPAKQPWWIWINTSCEFILNDCLTTTKQSTTKPCAYFLGYTVSRLCLSGVKPRISPTINQHKYLHLQQWACISHVNMYCTRFFKFKVNFKLMNYVYIYYVHMFEYRASMCSNDEHP